METKYNGWANHATWNVVLWIMNDEYFYNEALKRKAKWRIYPKPFNGVRAKMFAQRMFGGTKTPDDVGMSRVKWSEVAAALNELE